MCALKCIKLNLSNIYQINKSIILQCNVYDIIKYTYLVADTFDKCVLLKLHCYSILNISL